MIILIDFENTHASGFQGVEYLDEKDTLVVYYSDENSAVSKGLVEDLRQKNVHVRMVKLLKQHSNALDMYIASTTGMFLDTGEKICIVSKDRGYAAVRDFWHSLRGAEILLGETIEECFLNSVANDDERIRRAKDRSQKALLTESFETMNNIPTRPTLSRSNYWRRKKQINYDLSKHLAPVEILPNPLAKPEQENGYSVEETELVDLVEEIKEELALKRNREEEDSFILESTPDAVSDGSEAIKEEMKEEGHIEDKTESIPEIKHESFRNDNPQLMRREMKKNDNQVRFVYDPVKKAMMKVEETESLASSEEREENHSPVSNLELSGENVESARTHLEDVHEEYKKRNNRRRDGRKKETERKLSISGEKEEEKKNKQVKTAPKDEIKEEQSVAVKKNIEKEEQVPESKKDAAKEKRPQASKKGVEKEKKSASTKRGTKKETITVSSKQESEEKQKSSTTEKRAKQEEKAEGNQENTVKRSRRRNNTQKSKKKEEGLNVQDSTSAGPVEKSKE